ncbi:MAG: hypothetical protein M3O70_15565 [Actinomycetota bacterium]|nr:hypothetical protein [Actinomycetota bacterium]
MPPEVHRAGQELWDHDRGRVHDEPCVAFLANLERRGDVENFERDDRERSLGLERQRIHDPLEDRVRPVDSLIEGYLFETDHDLRDVVTLDLGTIPRRRTQGHRDR